MTPYHPLLDRHDAMIHNEPWGDGRREKLVAEMDQVWDRMTPRQRDKAMAYAWVLYRRRIV